MTARQVEEASNRLHELRLQTFEDLVLAALAAGLALASTRVNPVLAVPFLLGALGVGALGVRALVRRALLVEDLAVDGDAYTIGDVRKYAARAASIEGRRVLAYAIRSGQAERLDPVRTELDALVAALLDVSVAFDPHEFVALERWVRDPVGSFRNPSIPVVELRSRLRRILLDLDRKAP